MISRTNLIVIGLISLVNEKVAHGATIREPSIQAYGLPKRFLTDNGNIEQIYLGGNIAADEGAPKVYRGGDPSSVRRKFERESTSSEDGTIEIIHVDSSDEIATKFNPRYRRSIVEHQRSGHITVNDGELMKTDESKVFRPLFVYRQQVAAKRRRIQREKDIRNHPRNQSNDKKPLPLSSYYYTYKPQSG